MKKNMTGKMKEVVKKAMLAWYGENITCDIYREEAVRA